MLKRQIEPVIKKYSREYPVLAIVGPRQSGKTTLAKSLFPNHTYISFENLDIHFCIPSTKAASPPQSGQSS